MIRKITGFSLLATALLGLFPLACKPGGVGDPCIPEDEYGLTFPGYNAKEVNVESKSFQCETRVCLGNHFQGRVSCKYGQADPAGDPSKASCHVPGDPNKPILVKVDPQLEDRQADRAVYCSCRCDGENKDARYCSCPSGYACTHLVDDLHFQTGGQLAGSYCVRDGTLYDPSAPTTPCSPLGYTGGNNSGSCGEPTDG